MFWLPIAIGAGLGLGKTALDSAGRKRDTKVQAATTRYSGWTGQKAKEPREVNLFNDFLTGAGAGAVAGSLLGGAGAATQAPTSMTVGMSPKYSLSPELYGSLNPNKYSLLKSAYSPWYGMRGI